MRNFICNYYMAKIKKSMTLSRCSYHLSFELHFKSSVQKGRLSTISSIEDLDLNRSQMLQLATKVTTPSTDWCTDWHTDQLLNSTCPYVHRWHNYDIQHNVIIGSWVLFLFSWWRMNNPASPRDLCNNDFATNIPTTLFHDISDVLKCLMKSFAVWNWNSMFECTMFNDADKSMHSGPPSWKTS